MWVSNLRLFNNRAEIHFLKPVNLLGVDFESGILIENEKVVLTDKLLDCLFKNYDKNSLRTFIKIILK